MKINLFIKFWGKLLTNKEMYSHDGVYLHSNATWLCSEMTEPELCEFIILFKYLLLIGF